MVINVTNLFIQWHDRRMQSLALVHDVLLFGRIKGFALVL